MRSGVVASRAHAAALLLRRFSFGRRLANLRPFTPSPPPPQTDDNVHTCNKQEDLVSRTLNMTSEYSVALGNIMR